VDKRKQSIYFSVEILKEIADAATRLDRSMSWIVQKAWKIARAEMGRVPSATARSSEPGSEAAPDQSGLPAQRGTDV
jgi:uncharacterized small protein (TIGR04563 family)